MPKDKIVVRNLPHWVTEDILNKWLSAHPSLALADSSSAYTLVKLKKGKAANKHKNRPPVPSWAIFTGSQNGVCEKIASAFDGAILVEPTVSPAPVQNGSVSAVLTSPSLSSASAPVFVEYTPLQMKAIPAATPAGDDKDCGKIFVNPSYLRFVAKLNGGIGNAANTPIPTTSTSSFTVSSAPPSAAATVAEPPTPTTTVVAAHPSISTATADKIAAVMREADERAAKRIAAGSTGNMKLIDHILKLWYVDETKVSGGSRRDRGGRRAAAKTSTAEDVDAEKPVLKRKAKLRSDENKSKREKEREKKEAEKGGLSGRSMEDTILRKQLKEEKKQRKLEEKQALLDLIERKRKERQERRDAKAAIAAMATATLAATRAGASSANGAGTPATASSGSKFTVSTARQGINKPPTAKDLKGMPSLGGGDDDVTMHPAKSPSTPSVSPAPPSASSADAAPKMRILKKEKPSAESPSDSSPSSFTVTAGSGTSSSSFMVTAGPASTPQPSPTEKDNGRKRDEKPSRRDREREKEKARREEKKKAAATNNDNSVSPPVPAPSIASSAPVLFTPDDKSEKNRRERGRDRTKNASAQPADTPIPTVTPSTTSDAKPSDDKPARERSRRGGRPSNAETPTVSITATSTPQHADPNHNCVPAGVSEPPKRMLIKKKPKPEASV